MMDDDEEEGEDSSEKEQNLSVIGILNATSSEFMKNR